MLNGYSSHAIRKQGFIYLMLSQRNFNALIKFKKMVIIEKLCAEQHNVQNDIVIFYPTYTNSLRK